jgi:hypothetical protein
MAVHLTINYCGILHPETPQEKAQIKGGLPDSRSGRNY